MLGNVLQRISQKNISPEEINDIRGELFFADKIKEAVLMCDAAFNAFRDDFDESWGRVLKSCGDLKKISNFSPCEILPFYIHSAKHSKMQSNSVSDFLKKHKDSCNVK
jgi:hypothetical protein